MLPPSRLAQAALTAEQQCLGGEAGLGSESSSFPLSPPGHSIILFSPNPFASPLMSVKACLSM